MKKVILTICTFCLGLVTALAQPSSQNSIPKTMSYQAIIRNGSQGLIANGNITVRISIIKGSEFGSPVFVETHNSKTNSNGLATLEIGGGIPLFGSFHNIDWSNGPYFLRTETDPLGGTEYGITSISPILTLPYAMHALRALNADSVKVEKDPLFSKSLAASITSNDTANWNNKVQIEVDPVFAGSIAYTLNDSIISRWDSSIVAEVDPLFNASPASSITDTMINRWNSSLIVEKDPLFIAWDKDYEDLINKPITDGSETKILAGRNISISGNGKKDSEYIISYNASTLPYTMITDTYTIPDQVTVALITSNDNGTTDAITLPNGTNGQMLYIIYIATNDKISIDSNVFPTERKFTYIYANGWHLMSTK